MESLENLSLNWTVIGRYDPFGEERFAMQGKIPCLCIVEETL
jgi:hypothetical protein